jgi:dTDP-glucose 4,6-dehydratase
MRRTIEWYLNNDAWLSAVTSGAYHDWVSLQYAAA